MKWVFGIKKCYNLSISMSPKNKKQPTFIDLFAGIGGFHLAFHKNGAECVFASEWNDFKNGNFVGDITKVKPKDIPDFDIICGGFPCQPFSQAGFKKGFKDERGNLFSISPKL